MFNLAFPKNTVIQYPSGRWGFVGKVDVRLAWVNKDGTEIDSDTAQRIASASIPSLIAKSRSFESKDAAINYAESLGLIVTK